MKNLFFSLKAVKTAAVFAALTVLLFAGCSNPSDGPDGPNNPNGGSGLTITNLPSGGTYAVYVFASGTDISNYTAIANAYSSGSYQAVGTASSGGVFALNGWNGSSQTGAWTGSGSRPVLLLNSSGGISSSTNPMYSYTTVNFSNGNGTASFSNFTAVVYSGVDPGPNPGSGGSLTITSLPNGGTYAVYVFASGTDISTYNAILNAYTSGSYQAVGAVSSGNVFTLYGWNGMSQTSTWTGSGNLPVLLLNSNGVTTSSENPMYSHATVTFSNGSGTAGFSSFAALVYDPSNPYIPPIDPNNPKGKLTIDNFPAGSTLAINVFDYDEEIECLTDITTVQTNTTKLLAVGAATSSLVGLQKASSPYGTFDGNGTYLVLLANAATLTSWYADQVEFTDGCAEVDISTLGLVSELPLIHVTKYTVTFNSNGGSSVADQRVVEGEVASSPVDPVHPDQNYTFTGWYDYQNKLYNFDIQVTDDITLYAKWGITITNTTLAEKLNWLDDNAEDNIEYLLIVTADESLGPRTLSYTGKNSVTIKLEGSGSIKAITLSENGSLFTIDTGVTLILDNNIILKGKSDNNNALVSVNVGGGLVMRTGAKITDNTNPSSYNCGGVRNNGTFTMEGGEISGNQSTDFNGSGGVRNNGTFIMNGGEISNNSASRGYGGGVGVFSGNFIMNGGKIHDNTVNSWSNSSTGDKNGGGVSVSGGNFIMNGGEIYNNKFQSNVYYEGGHGVGVLNGNFIMNGGKIHDNSGNTGEQVYVRGRFTMENGEIYNSIDGCGVIVYYTGEFTMNNGEIYNNTTGVSVGTRSTSGYDTLFTMNDGKIYGNGNTGSDGGGVYVGSNTIFTMNGGEISSNTARDGGGVYVSGLFTKTGGTIYGTNGLINANIAKDASSGNAVFVGSSKRRETTAGPTVNLDSDKNGSAGGWE